MKTEVILKRPFLDGEVSQLSKCGYFNANELVKIGNVKRRKEGLIDFNLNQFLNNKGTLEFIQEIEKDNGSEAVQRKGKGAGSKTWVHPLLLIDIALALNPKFKLEVYQWMYDELLRFRNQSGSSYSKMAGALYETSTDKGRFHKEMITIANHIKNTLNVDDWNSTTQEKLKQRDEIHNNIALLCKVMRDRNQIVRLAIEEVIK